MDKLQQLTRIKNVYDMYVEYENLRMKRKPTDPFYKRRDEDGEYKRIYCMLTDNTRRFFSYTRMEPGVFQQLLGLVEPRYVKLILTFVCDKIGFLLMPTMPSELNFA